jgi:hypothetical protein
MLGVSACDGLELYRNIAMGRNPKAVIELSRSIAQKDSQQTCGSAAPIPVLGGLNVGIQPREMDGSRMQRMSAFRP